MSDAARSAPKSKKLDRADLGSQMLAAGTVGLTSFVNPIAGIIIGGLAPAAVAGAAHTQDWLRSRRHGRKETFLMAVVAAAGIEFEELENRLRSRPELEELLNYALQAVGDTASPDKLVVLAAVVASGITDVGGDLLWQRAFARAVRDLGAAHVELLGRFTRTSNDLGLGDGPEFDVVPSQLNDVQVKMVGDDLPALEALLATLQDHGLLAHDFVGGGSLQGGGGAYGVWRLTEFGTAAHELLMTIGETLRPASSGT